MDTALNIWPTFGFRKNPYGTEELKPDSEGDELLIGRDAEVRKLQRRWYSSTQIATLEGPVGVGKTSLAGVAAYRAMQVRLAARSELIVPLNKTIQFEADTQSLTRKILFEIAQALLRHETTFRNCGHPLPNLNDLRSWVNNPVFKGGSVGIAPLSAGKATPSPNSTSGFSESGFEEHITYLLRECFPEDKTGSLVGVVDNLELLRTAGSARECLDQLRDTAFKLPGIRWVLVGATGIVKTAVSVPRLSGKVANPIQLEPVTDEYLSSLIEKRINYYAASEGATAPVNPKQFQQLYAIAGKNLRDTFKHAQDIALWLFELSEDGKPTPINPVESWIEEQADYGNIATQMTAAAQEVFDELVKNGGAIPAAQLADDPSTYAQKVRYRVRILEKLNLAETVGTEDDLRFKVVRLTALGWFTHHVRSSSQGSH
ncbi:ATP-binding protein [Rhodococcus sp. SBT000017]|uniref:ATP-binding protein n=1 Tax=Rhodococcus sp. SBT000017 TaxID=1803385 RepID=UPI0011C4130E|nr:ATP-binding protein [Rhodococcus sp. SBT000017]